MKKLTIEQLAIYLPYELECQTKHNISILSDLTTSNIYECASFVDKSGEFDGENGMIHLEDFKPLLLPLSLYADINSKEMNDLNCGSYFKREINSLANSHIIYVECHYYTIKIMARNHIDFQDLIGQGLAIDKRTVGE